MKKEDTLILEKLLTFYYSLSLSIYIYTLPCLLLVLLVLLVLKVSSRRSYNPHPINLGFTCNNLTVLFDDVNSLHVKFLLNVINKETKTSWVVLLWWPYYLLIISRSFIQTATWNQKNANAKKVHLTTFRILLILYHVLIMSVNIYIYIYI